MPCACVRVLRVTPRLQKWGCWDSASLTTVMEARGGLQAAAALLLLVSALLALVAPAQAEDTELKALLVRPARKPGSIISAALVVNCSPAWLGEPRQLD